MPIGGTKRWLLYNSTKYNAHHLRYLLLDWMCVSKTIGSGFIENRRKFGLFVIVLFKMKLMSGMISFARQLCKI